MSNIQGKIIILTGASSGIGATAAKSLAAKGARVVLGARNLKGLDGNVEEIRAQGGEAIAVQADVTKREGPAALVRAAVERFGGLDVLINNAGVGPISPLDELRVDDWEAMIDVNVKGVLYGIAAALPIFRRQKHGHFINIISTAGISIVPTMAVYAATKNAVRTITEGLRQESAGDFRVTGISPGFVKTNFVSSMTNEAVKENIQRQMDKIGLDPHAIVRAMEFALEQPPEVDINEITIRPTVQG